MERQITHILAEIGAARRLDAERLATQRNLVEVELEDLFLGQHAFDAARDDHFLELAGDRILVADQDVLGHLLGDGRAALRPLARTELGHIVQHGASKPGEVHPAVGPEGLVLGCQIGVDQAFGKIDEAQLHPAFAGIGMDDLAIHAAHHGRQRRLVIKQLVGRWQVARDQQPAADEHQQASEQAIARQPEPAAFAPAQARTVEQVAQAFQPGAQAGRPPARVAADTIAGAVRARRPWGRL